MRSASRNWGANPAMDCRRMAKLSQSERKCHRQEPKRNRIRAEQQREGYQSDIGPIN
jgi:hypothetical protein